jgi:hypothetical protein
MSPADCGPQPGFSRDVAIIGSVSNELWCGVEAQQDLAKSAPFRNLADGEFIKIMCVRNGSPPSGRFGSSGPGRPRHGAGPTHGPARNAHKSLSKTGF